MLLSIAETAFACLAVSPLPSARQLVERAAVVVRARATGLSAQPGEPGAFAGVRTQVVFEVLEVLKGEVPTSALHFNGVLSDADDANDKAVPYSFVRPGGRHGNCFALGYRPGAEYLLLLRSSSAALESAPGALTPYWAPLGATNEQLTGGATDPWLVWVRQQITKSPGA